MSEIERKDEDQKWESKRGLWQRFMDENRENGLKDRTRIKQKEELMEIGGRERGKERKTGRMGWKEGCWNKWEQRKKQTKDIRRDQNNLEGLMDKTGWRRKGGAEVIFYVFIDREMAESRSLMGNVNVPCSRQL